jgi:hypothetical protein
LSTKATYLHADLKGQRYWDFAAHAVSVKGQRPAPGFAHTLLIRRALSPKATKAHPEGVLDVEYFLVHARTGTAVPQMIAAAGLRWNIEDDNRVGKDLLGLNQRHLLFAGDAWLGNAVLEEEAPYHPLGFPAGGMPPDAAAELGLILDATPTLDEVLGPRLTRMATMRSVVNGLTEAELDRVCGRKPADPYPDQEYVVRRCLKVVLKEEAEHHRYAVRDLAVLEAGA